MLLWVIQFYVKVDKLTLVFQMALYAPVNWRKFMYEQHAAVLSRKHQDEGFEMNKTYKVNKEKR